MNARPEAPDYPIELTAPDISAYRNGNTGIEYVHRIDSGEPGPTVMVNALTHGNEICGSIAVDHLFRNDIKPRRGTLVLGFGNIEAHSRWDPDNPYASRYVDEDFNRLWTEERLDGPDDTVELRRARILRPVFDEIDMLLDVHSMGTNSRALTLCNGLGKERDLARSVGYPADVVCGPVFAKGKRIIEYTPFNDTTNGKVGLLVECGQHWAKETGVAAIETMYRFLVATGAIDAEDAEPHLTVDSPEPVRLLDVTDGIASKTDHFRFTEQWTGFEKIPKAGTTIAMDGDEPITTPYDDCILIMPNHRTSKGQRALRLARQS